MKLAELTSGVGALVLGVGLGSLFHDWFASGTTVILLLGAARRSSRIALINTRDGLVALNSVKELMADRGRPHDNLYEVALWADMLRVQGDELFYAYMVDNQAIVIPETIDAIRALTGALRDGSESIARTNAALAIHGSLVGPGVGEPAHR
jgi:glyceraldehyde-3-phosphate dehydrogenase (NAD(P))